MQVHASRTPSAAGRSFAHDLKITHGPRAMIERYFSAATQFLADRDITLRRVDPMDMVAVNRSNSASWWRQVPILDAEDNPPQNDNLVAFIGYLGNGEPVTAMSVRYFDFRGTTLKAEMESMRMFFGDRAELMRRNVDFQITSPSSEAITGEIAYMGGFWVHPSARGRNLSLVIPRLARYASLGLWGVDYDVSLTTQPFYSRKGVVDRYDFEAIEPHYTYVLNGRLMWEGQLVWSTREHLEAALPSHVAQAGEQLRVDGSSRQKAL